jgi:tetratricopeptide (TPR) repeat protein
MEDYWYILYSVVTYPVAEFWTPRQVAGGTQMKWGRVLVPLLALASSRVCLAQDNPPAPDPTQRAVTQAMRDGRITDAEKLLTDAIHELEQSDPQNPRMARCLKSLSQIMDRQGRRADAIALIKRAHEIDRSAYGPSDLRNTNDLTLLASYAQVAGNNSEDERLLNEALEIVRSNTAELKTRSNIDLAAAVLGSLSTLYISEHRWAEAEPLLQEESKLCDSFEEPFRAGYGLCGSLPERLKEVYIAEGRSVEAEQMQRDMNFPRELDALNKIAEKYKSDGLYPAAEEAYNRAIAMAEKMEADPQNRYGGLIVTEMNSLGQLFEKDGFKDRAERTYANALEVNEKQAGPDRGYTGDAQMLDPHYLIDLYRSEGRLQDAEPLLQRVLETQVRSLGERHRVVVQTLTTFAGVYEEEGKSDEAKYAKALPLYERALAIQDANLGPDDRERLYLLGNYMSLLLKLHDPAKAAEVRARMAKISSAEQNDPK